MKIGHNRKKQAVTLIELILAILLLSSIVLGGYSVELAMRSMSVRPRDDSRLLDELIPIKEKIGKDFEYYAYGNYMEDGVDTLGAPQCPSGIGNGLKINVGGGVWRGYCWRSAGAPTDKYQFRYYPNVASGSYEVIGIGVSNFVPTIYPTDKTKLSISISTKKDPTQPVEPFSNPEVTLNATFYARGVSAS